MHSAAPPASVDPRDDRRRKVFLPAEMAGADGRSRIHLLNLSTTGALVHADTLPRPGTVVAFSCAGSTWPVRVVWTRDRRFGVTHITPLAPSAIDALLERESA